MALHLHHVEVLKVAKVSRQDRFDIEITRDATKKGDENAKREKMVKGFGGRGTFKEKIKCIIVLWEGCQRKRQ